MILPAMTLTLLLLSAVATDDPAGHAAGVDARGDHAMGFDHTKTTHHFLLTDTGGEINVSANDEADPASRDHIRQHLRQVASMFTAGDFSLPMFIHDKMPPGATAMKQAGAKITYAYDDTPKGARVVLRTDDKEALAAIHDFLRFQIQDHRTGDPQ